MFRIRRSQLRAGGGSTATPADPSPSALSRAASPISPPAGGSTSQGRWRSAPEVEDLGGIVGTREQVLAAIRLQRWRRWQAGGGKVAPPSAKELGGARWRSAPEVQDLCEVLGTREQVLACIQIQRWRRRPSRPTSAERRDVGELKVQHATAEDAAFEEQPRERKETSPELSTPSQAALARSAQSSPTTAQQRARPEPSLVHTRHAHTSHAQRESYHSDRCAESGKLRELCACAACATPQAAARRERDNTRHAAALVWPQ